MRRKNGREQREGEGASSGGFIYSIRQRWSLGKALDWMYHFSCCDRGGTAAVTWALHSYNCLHICQLSASYGRHTQSLIICTVPLLIKDEREHLQRSYQRQRRTSNSCVPSPPARPASEQTLELIGNVWLTSPPISLLMLSVIHTRPSAPCSYSPASAQKVKGRGAYPFPHNDIIIQTTGVYRVDQRCNLPKQPSSVEKYDKRACRFSLGWDPPWL